MKKKDFLLIGIVLAVALIALLVVQLLKEDGAYVSVRIDGVEVATYSLSVDGEYSLNGGTNVLKIENGEAWMLEADCPTRGQTRCTAQGKISRTTESITCEPHKLTVVVRGGQSPDVDLIS